MSAPSLPAAQLRRAVLARQLLVDRAAVPPPRALERDQLRAVRDEAERLAELYRES